MSPFSARVYQVHDQQTHKYTSTTVSGGGYVAPDTGGRVAISSSTTHHSDQEVWVSDTISGKERRLHYSEFNVAVRPGHRIVEVRHARGNVVRVYNANTETSFGSDAAFNPWCIDATHRYGAALLYTIFALIPGLGAVLMPIILLTTVIKGGISSKDSGISAVRKAALATFAIWAVAFAWGAFDQQTYASFFQWWMAWHFWPAMVQLAGMIWISRIIIQSSTASDQEIRACVQSAITSAPQLGA